MPFALRWACKSERCSFIGPDDVKMINSLYVRDFDRCDQVRSLQVFVVQVRVLSACFGPCIKMPQLDPENGCLETVQTAVDPFHFMVILVDAPVIGEHTRFFGKDVVTGHYRAGIAVSAKVLAGIEAEACHIAHGPDGFPLV